MQYYRRNLLDVVTEGLANQAIETGAGLTPTRYAPAPLENVLSGLPASAANSAVPVELPTSFLPAANLPLQNAAELVQKAVEILDKEMAAGLLAAQRAYSPTLPYSLPASASVPPSTPSVNPAAYTQTANPTILPNSIPSPFMPQIAMPLSAAKPGAVSSPPTDLLSLLYSLPTQGAGLGAGLPFPVGMPGLGGMQPAMAEELMRNVQRLVTSFMNLVAESQRNAALLADVASRSVYDGNTDGTTDGTTMGDDTNVPLLRPKRAATAGEKTTIALRVDNDSTQMALAKFQCADLIDHTGYRIPSLRVTVSPREIPLAPGASVNATLTIDIPLATPPGIYSGLLTAPTLSYLHAVVLVTVI